MNGRALGRSKVWTEASEGGGESTMLAYGYRAMQAEGPERAKAHLGSMPDLFEKG